MKNTNSISEFIVQKNSKINNPKESGQGITKRLLEKYKPKDIYKIDRVSNKEHMKRVA